MLSLSQMFLFFLRVFIIAWLVKESSLYSSCIFFIPIHRLTFVFVAKTQEVENNSVFTATKGQLYSVALTRTGVGNISVLALGIALCRYDLILQFYKTTFKY